MKDLANRRKQFSNTANHQTRENIQERKIENLRVGGFDQKIYIFFFDHKKKKLRVGGVFQLIR